MDHSNLKYLEAPPLFPSHGDVPLESNNNGFYKTRGDNPFLDTFPDPLCQLNLKETSEFVKSLPMANHGDVSVQRREGVSLSSVTKRNVEAPSTPGRPIFSFSTVGNNLSRKPFPSKWDDAEKWLISGSSCHDSPAHHHHLHVLKPSDFSKMSKQFNGIKLQEEGEGFAEKSRVTEEKVSKAISSFQGPVSLDHHSSAIAFHGVTASADVLLKDFMTADKFTNEVEQIFPKFRCSEPMKEGFLFGKSTDESMKEGFLFGKSTDESMKEAATDTEVVHEFKHRDIGTEMTPLGSCTTSRCHTPFKSSSPARHNTPANRSGPLEITNPSTIDIAQLQECHLAKLNFGTQCDSITSNWSSREEEEEDVSKSLRHFEMTNECRRSISENRTCTWEEEEKSKFCLRYQREEANIQAWVNLQNAKAEAQSRKLEVKIQKMQSNLEEKLMKRMAVVHRKAEEWRAAAQIQHTEQIQRASDQAQKMINRKHSHFSRHGSCGCFPSCNNHRC